MTVKTCSVCSRCPPPGSGAYAASAGCPLAVSGLTRAHLGVVRLGDLACVARVREGGAGPLQGAVDGGDRGPELRGDLGGAELQYLTEHQHGPLPRR